MRNRPDGSWRFERQRSGLGNPLLLTTPLLGDDRACKDSGRLDCDFGYDLGTTAGKLHHGDWSSPKPPSQRAGMARLFGVPSLWLQRSREAEGSARVFGTEMILNVTRRVLLLRATSVVEPGAGKTHRQATEHAQNGHGRTVRTRLRSSSKLASSRWCNLPSMPQYSRRHCKSASALHGSGSALVITAQVLPV